MKKFLLLHFLIVALFIFSCGEEKKMPPKENNTEVVEPGEIDACSLISKEEVEKILAAEMSEPKKGRSQKGSAERASFSECSYSSAEKGTSIYLSVYVRLTPFKDEFHSTIQTVRKSFEQSDIEIKDINDIGDVAFWGGNQLHVFKGDHHYLIITLIGINERDEAIEKAKSLAEVVIRNFDSV